MRKRTSYYIGLILIIIGAGALYNSIFLDNLFSMRNMWPLFILLPGLFLETDYFANYRNRDASMLIPAGILTLMGGFFLVKQFVPIMDELTGSIFIVIVGFSLLQYYAAKPRDRGILIISLALILLGGFLGYARYVEEMPYWLNRDSIRAIAILLLGLYLVFRALGRDKKPDSTYRPREEYTRERQTSQTPPPSSQTPSGDAGDKIEKEP